MLTAEGGFRLARLTGANVDDERREQIAASRDALGILLSLMLAFTLAMALPRFDLRKQLVMEEANAIGTTNLRAGMLPEPQRSQVRALLQEYARARYAYTDTSPASPSLHRQFSAATRCRLRFGKKPKKSRGKTRRQSRPMFVASLSETIDLSEKRLSALENRIPLTIWWMLALIAVLTSLTFGCGQRRRFWLIAIISLLMIAIVMGLVAGLDSPRSGFLRVNLGSLERLEQDLHNIPAPHPAPSSDGR
jgi:hypothetical protein